MVPQKGNKVAFQGGPRRTILFVFSRGMRHMSVQNGPERPSTARTYLGGWLGG